MKKLAVLLLVVGLIFFSCSVMAQNQEYLEVKLGITVMEEFEFGGTNTDIYYSKITMAFGMRF